MNRRYPILIVILSTIVAFGCGGNSDPILELSGNIVTAIQSGDVGSYKKSHLWNIDRNYIIENSNLSDSEKVAILSTYTDPIYDNELKKWDIDKFFEISNERFWTNAVIIRIVKDSSFDKMLSIYYYQTTIDIRGSRSLQISGILKVGNEWKFTSIELIK